eukprot:EG_transcript_8545
MAAVAAATAVGPPQLAVVAPPDVDPARCVTGRVVVDQFQKDMGVLHAQLRSMTVISKLCIASHIADGTWASVYRVHEEESGRLYALKVVPADGAAAAGLPATLALLRRLRHPNVVQYHRHFVHRVEGVRCLCVQLEYCEHGTLARYLQARAARTAALSARRVREFAVQLAAALAFIHEQGYLHGDLRAETVLLAGAGKQVKLSGFGSPLRLERWGLSPCTVTGGCKAYAPPEWMDSEVPHRELQPWEKPLPSYDMWSLGCVLSELVTLKLLRNDRRYLRTALATDPDGLRAVAQEVTAAHRGLFSTPLGRLLEVDPDVRISATAVLSMLQDLQPPAAPSFAALLCWPRRRSPSDSPPPPLTQQSSPTAAGGRPP